MSIAKKNNSSSVRLSSFKKKKDKVVMVLVRFVERIWVIFMVLLGVVFITLLERKVIGFMQRRIGPDKVGYRGIIQRVRDGFKLFLTDNLNFNKGFLSGFYLRPVFCFFISLALWLVLPLFFYKLDFKIGLLYFLVLLGIGVFPLIIIGWVSRSKYSIYGALRGAAQIISYEISLMVVVLVLVWFFFSFNIRETRNILFFLPLMLVWLFCLLAEAHRTPFDFSEGESELVSGFNTDFRRVWFVFIFFIWVFGFNLYKSVVFTYFFRNSFCVSFSRGFCGVVCCYLGPG